MNLLVKAALAGAALLAVGGAAGCASGTAATGAGPARAAASSAAASSAAAAAPRGSVPACIAFGVRAIDEHRTVTQMPAACRGLSRAEVNFALGRAIYLVAGSGQRKVAWRRHAAVEGARLAKLITALAQPSPGAGPGSLAARGAGRQPGPVDRRPLGLAALAAWLLTVGSGGYMLGRFVAGGGLRRQRAAGDRTGPAVVLSHFALASTGLLLWAVYLATSVLGLAWAAVGLLLPVIGFGMATLIVWTSGTSRRASRTSAAPPGTSAAPPGPVSGTSAAPAGTSAAPAGTSAAPAGTSAAPAGTSAAPAGTSPARAGTSPAGEPRQVQVAAVRDQPPQGQAAVAPAPGRRPSRWLTVIIPIGHGLLASATILLALLTALGAT